MNRSTETAIYSFLANIQELAEKKEKQVGIFCDLTKAYDAINHDTLFSKLQTYGVRGVANLWFKSYLAYRKQVVEISCDGKKYTLAPREIKYGVPQGSVFGPLLFLLYINDLPLNIKEARIVLFADDINILVTAEKGHILQQKINKVMNELYEWFNANSLILNTEKTIAMAFHNRQERDLMKPQIRFGKMEIFYKCETKFLGIHVGNHMEWKAHMMFLSSKLHKVCYMIKSLRDVTSRQVIRSIYFAHFHAYLKYGLIFWGSDRKSKTIFKLQKRVVRIISGVSRLASCRQLFKGLNVLPLPCMYIFEIVCHVKLHLEMLEQNNVVHNHNTRQKLNLHAQFCRTKAYKKGVLNMGIKLYNKIPNKIREVEKIRQFKKVMRSYLVQHTFYSVEEYMLN